MAAFAQRLSIIPCLLAVPFLLPPAPAAAVVPPYWHLYFEADDDSVASAAKEILDRLAATLSDYPDDVIVMEAHADPGEAGDLACDRATAVRQYLIGRGVSASRIYAVSYAATRTWVIGRDIANRRVDVRVQKKDAAREFVQWERQC